MKRLYLLFVSVVLFSAGLNAQVTITGAAPTIANGTTYTSLTNAGGAFAAINAVPAWAGRNIVLTITANTAETGLHALNQPATSSWITLSITPSGTRTVSGNVATSLISLNGADNVTINGINSGGNALTISNLSTSAIAGTSTVKFINDAANNTVNNCTILGSSTTGYFTPGGTIFFSTGSATGNDGNTISNSNIGPAGANLPVISIFGKGSTASTAIGNSGITINNNNIYNYFSAVEHSAGMYIEEGCNNWSVTINKFYQTAGRTFTSATLYQHSAIRIESTDPTSGAQLFAITGNIIGYATNTQTGTYSLSGARIRFVGIEYSGIDGAASTVSSNTIASVSLSGSDFGDPFYGIIIGSGLVTSNLNVIGSQTTTGSINVSINNSSPGLIAGIYNFGSDNWISSNNTIGGITANNISTGNLQIYGLRAWLGAGNTWTCTNNIIGGTITNSIQNTTPGFASRVTGILNTGSIINATGNTIRNLSANGPLEGISNGSTATATISNNTISNLTMSANSSSQLYGIHSSVASVNVFNNTISSLTVVGSSGIAVALGISGTTLNVYSNVITSISSQAGTYGIYIPDGITVNVYSNTINTLSSSGFSLYGMRLEGTPGTTITAYSNTINTLSATTAASVYGISFYGDATVVNAYKNKIYDLSGSHAGSLVYGAHVNSPAPSLLNFYNNLIGDLRNTNATGSGLAITGYYSESTQANSTQNVYFNTFYLNAVSAGASFSTAGIYYTANTTATTARLNLRNNIIVNTSTPSGAGTTVAYRRSTGTAGTLANYGSGSNNNLFYAGTPGASRLIYSDGTSSATTLALYKAGVFTAGTIAPRDAASVTENPPFVSLVGANANFLHIDPAIPTLIESNAANLGITDDYDGNIRNVSTPDIGADEFNGIAADVTAPSIGSITLIGTACSLTSRNVTAVISDAGGINNAGFPPRIYFRKNAGAYFSAAGTLSSGTVNSGTWTFTITYATLGGVTAADVIGYFIVAQDVSGNVAGNPSGGLVLTNVNTVTTPPTTPLTYTIISSIGGTYGVGIGQTYTTLTAAIAAYNTSCLSSAVTFLLTDAVYTEAAAMTINANADASAVRTLTIRPIMAGTTIGVTGGSTGAVLILNDADYIIIDGSTAGATAGPCLVGGAAAIRNLTIQNTNAGTGAVVISVQSGTNGAKNNTIKNVNILGQDPLTTLAGITLGGNTPGTAGTDNDNNRVENCSIKRAIYGIYSSGISAANQNTGTVITKNDLAALTTDRIRRIGMFVFNEDGIQITENSVGGIDNTGESADAIAIGVGTQNINNSNTTSGNVTNALISKNKINGVSQDNTFSAAGIAVAGGTTGANTIANNMITGVISDGNGTDLVSGIHVVGVTGSNTKLYYNSVSMTGDRSALLTPGTAMYPGYGISITGVDPTVELKNNILYNTQTADLAANPGARSYAIGMVSTLFANLNTDHNDFWTTGIQDGGFRTGSLAPALGTDHATVALWATAIADEVNSLEIDPLFINAANNLHITVTNCVLDGKGIPVAGITDDYDCNTRDVTTPDMGADEFTATYTGTLAGIAGSAICENKTVSVSGTSYATSACNLIARVLPSGGSAVTGKVNVCVTLDATLQYFNGEPYVQRHHDIEPETSPATATGTITLYYTDAEFVSYNTLNPVWPDLPTTAGGGNADPNRANVRITQFHGTPTGGLPTSTPGNYTGAIALITPGAANVFWNGSYWAVTFTVTGFSGFYLHTTITNTPLPVSINYFTGVKQGSDHLLNWKVTCNSTPHVTITLERSADSRNFTAINSITADALRCNQPFNYTDIQPLSGMNYYRLKMTDANGKISYSGIVALLNATKGFNIIGIAPNPVTNGNFKLNVASAKAGNMEITIIDIQGRIVKRQSISLIGGFNSVPVNVSNLSSGTYTMYGSIGEDRSGMIRFVKQ